MVFSIGVVLWLIGFFVFRWHYNPWTREANNGEAVGLLFISAGSLLMLLSGLILACAYLP